MAEYLTVNATLHCGRLEFRRKTIKESAINLSNVFTKRRMKRAFTNDTIPVRLSLDENGLVVEGGNIDHHDFKFSNNEIIPYGSIANIYIAFSDFRESFEKLADWSKYFQPFSPDSSTDAIRSVIIVCRNLHCILFFIKERMASIQNSITKILEACANGRLADFNSSNSYASIQYRHLKVADGAAQCPLNDPLEWQEEYNFCFSPGEKNNGFGAFKGFHINFKNNAGWSNSLSQCYPSPELFSSTIWLYSHENGSMIAVGSRDSENVNRRDAEVFVLDDVLFEMKEPQRIFSELAQQIIADHYKDWLASEAIFWGLEGELTGKWLGLVSKVLKVTSAVVEAVISKSYKAVLLLSFSRSLSLVVGALSQLCLSAKTRTSPESFSRLIKKCFVSLGFIFRTGVDQNPNPLFILFLDCCYQLMCQNIADFGLSTTYLSVLANSFLTEYFYEFSFSTPMSRADACRRRKGLYRWFFPIENHFTTGQLASFINSNYASSPVVPQSNLVGIGEKGQAITMEKPISYYPFNLEEGQLRPPMKSLNFRSHSEGNLLEYVSSSGGYREPNKSLGSRMSKAARSLFRPSRPVVKGFVIYKPLTLQKAVIQTPFPSPVQYFNRDNAVASDTVIRPRWQLPCLRFWDEFILGNEFDFDTLVVSSEKNNRVSNGVISMASLESGEDGRQLVATPV